MKTGVQQVMLRENVKNEEQARAALAAIREAGYDGIELNRFMIHKLPWTIRVFTKLAGMAMGAGGNLDWKGLITESGLSVLSLHTDLGSLEKETDAILAEADSFGTDRVVLTGMYHYDYSDAQAVTDLILRVNKMGEKLSASGAQLFYHNHNCEFLTVTGAGTLPDGRPVRAYDRIIDETDPANVFFEFDSYWAAETGADPEEWMERLGGRMKLWHINDRGSRPKGKTGSILKSDSMELGTGCMPLASLMETSRACGTEAVILETHGNWVNKDALESIRVSGEYLKTNLLS